MTCILDLASRAYWIEQGSRKTPFIFNYEDTTYKRSQIQGIIDAVLQLDCPHHVVFISASPLALEKAEAGEGPNRDLIYELYRVLSAKGCTHAFDFRVGQGKEIKNCCQIRTFDLMLPASSSCAFPDFLLPY